jgi:hypothetical protein
MVTVKEIEGIKGNKAFRGRMSDVDTSLVLRTSRGQCEGGVYAGNLQSVNRSLSNVGGGNSNSW